VSSEAPAGVAARRFDDPARFLAHMAPLVAGAEARHNLILGLAGTLMADPTAYPEYRLWAVDRHGLPVAAALRTLDFQVVLADLTDRGAAAALAELVAAEAPDAPGVVGNRPSVQWFAQEWSRLTGSRPAVNRDQGVFALDAVADMSGAEGAPRTATPGDRDLLVEWITAFADEATPGDPAVARLRSTVDRRLAGPPEQSGFWLWEAGGEPVSLTGHSGPTGSGIRIGPVYTPPAYRRRGYATALVAAHSARLLERGYRFCFLYTDLGNPTSNAIYRSIGYRQVAESTEYRFVT